MILCKNLLINLNTLLCINANYKLDLKRSNKEEEKNSIDDRGFVHPSSDQIKETQSRAGGK